MTRHELRQTDNLRWLIQRSAVVAEAMGYDEPGPAHFLMSVQWRGPAGNVSRFILEDAGIDPLQLNRVIKDIYYEMEPRSVPTESLSAAIEGARQNAEVAQSPYIGDEHFLLAVLQLAGPVVRLAFDQLHVPVESALTQVQAALQRMEERSRAAARQLEVKLASEVSAAVDRLFELIGKGAFDEAYHSLTTPDFRMRTGEATFRRENEALSQTTGRLLKKCEKQLICEDLSKNLSLNTNLDDLMDKTMVATVTYVAEFERGTREIFAVLILSLRTNQWLVDSFEVVPPAARSQPSGGPDG